MPSSSARTLSQPRGPLARGRLILFEGIDGSGKTTQLALLKSHLEAKGPVHAFRFHDRANPVGKLIDSFLHGAHDLPPSVQFQLYTADFLLSAQRIRDLLDGGATVLLDRWLPSAIAYQSAQGFSQARALARLLPLPKPDHTLLFDLPPAVAVQRTLAHADRFDRNERLLTKVRANYLDLAHAKHWTILDATQSREALAAQVRTALRV